MQVIAKRGVYFCRMSSPVGHNMQQCASMFGIKVNNIDIVNRKTDWFLHSGLAVSDSCKVNIMSELLCCEVSFTFI